MKRKRLLRLTIAQDDNAVTTFESEIARFDAVLSRPWNSRLSINRERELP